MSYYDAHNHLQDEGLQPHLEQVLAELPGLGVAGVVVNGTSESDWPQVACLAARAKWILPSFGLHPWDVGNRSPRWEESLRRYLQTHPQAGLGEIGLDLWMLERASPQDSRLEGLRRAPLDEQIEVFLTQLQVAREFNRPVSIHGLDAYGPLLECLRATAVPARGFLLHAYGGPPELVSAFVELGAWFSFNGCFLENRRKKAREAFRLVPAERLLVETDAPAMLPPPPWQKIQLPPGARGEALNHPGNLLGAYAGLAQVRGESEEALQTQCADNYHRFFLSPRVKEGHSWEECPEFPSARNLPE